MRRLLLVCLLICGAKTASAVTGDFAIFIMNDDVARGSMAFYRAAGVDSFTDGLVATPNMDEIAAQGTRLDQLHVYSLCSPSRAAALGYGYVQRPSNLHGTTHDINDAVPDYTVEIDPEAVNLFRQMAAEGRKIAFFGKKHLSAQHRWYRTPPVASFLQRLGVDYADAVVQANATKLSPFYDMSAAEQSCLSDNLWSSCGLDETCSISTTYVDQEIADAAIAHMQAHYNEKWFYWVAFNGTHSPFKAGDTGTCTGFTGGDYLADNPNGIQDDRPPGSGLPVTASAVDVYEAALAYVDLRIGDIMAVMNEGNGLGGGDDEDVICHMSDNGIPVGMSRPAECAASEGQKGTPYPCGAVASFACAGGDIVAGGVVPGLHHVVDVPKTLLELVTDGATPASAWHDDGESFYSCLTGTPGDCVGHETVCYVEWDPMGGNDVPVDGSIERMPVPGTDRDDEWDGFEVACYTDAEDGNVRLLHRVYEAGNMSVGTFYERMFVQLSLADMLPTATGPIFETASPAGGALTSGGMSTAEDAARIVLQREIAGVMARAGLRASTQGIEAQGVEF